MKTLGLDTSTLMATCAIIEGDRLIGEYSLNQDMSHSEKLVPMIKEVLDSLGLRPKDIDLYGVSLGPGSFTGLRIGLATVKAFAHLFHKPLLGIPTLEALAFNLPHQEIIVPMLDARRDRVYTGVYSWEDNNIREVMGASIFEISDLIHVLKDYESIVVNGDGASLYKDLLTRELGSRVKFATIGQNSCKASSIAELAIKKYNQGLVDDYFTLAPDYLRPSQAERELNKKKVE